MKKSAPVSEIMTKKVITLDTLDSLITAEELFKKHHIRHIPVVHGKKVMGMLSYTDLLRLSFADAVNEDGETTDSLVYDMFNVSQIMASDVLSVSSQTTIREVAEFLSKKEFHALPVVDDGKLVGIVTTTDLINYLLRFLR